MTAPSALADAVAQGDQPPAGGWSPDNPSSPESGRARQARPAAGPALRVVSAALSILAALLLGFVVDVGLVGDLRHARDRQVDYAGFRADLANGVAPVGRSEGGGVAPEPGAPVALLEIPVLQLREVVREGTTAHDLARGAGHRRDTTLPGQSGVSVIMGRQATYGGPFRHLEDLTAGDRFTVTTGQGKHTYRVIGPRREGDPQPPALTGGRGRVTLITADGTPFMPRGILRVDADLVSDAQPTPPAALPSGALPEDEKPMAMQQTAWLPLVLWGQALVLAAAAIAWAHARWGRPHTWVVGVPLLGALGLAVADQAALLLPNLL
ncbi:sortase [Streptomyces lunaelactis]|uniref:Sortase n=1 Tax=Streptomyces lunaelactis TaxID=1535768 RepID=A0A2R4TA26_9ACTN|nr:sortase [Streptomyces lunaelactis]AVZ75941.1 sortase [Streptomyces lunaelactis]NUK87263.1 sortase [Streptomyces lunaelactis]